MSRNLLQICYGIPGVAIYALTVVSIISIRARFSSTFVAINLLTAVTNLITYVNAWTTLRLLTEQWFFPYYNFINQTVAIPYIHQFLIGYMYFTQHINATLLTIDRFIAIAALEWNKQWTRSFGLITVLCYIAAMVFYFGFGGFYDLNQVNSFMMQKAHLFASLISQVIFGAVILLFCALLNILSILRLNRIHLSTATVVILKRSLFFISFLIFITQTLNILILLSYFYLYSISLNTAIFKVIRSVMVFTSDLFSLGPGIYTFIIPVPIQKKCMELLLPCLKKKSHETFITHRISVQTTTTI